MNRNRDKEITRRSAEFFYLIAVGELCIERGGIFDIQFYIHSVNMEVAKVSKDQDNIISNVGSIFAPVLGLSEQEANRLIGERASNLIDKANTIAGILNEQK